MNEGPGGHPAVVSLPPWRTHGPPPYRVVVVHGGPGAPGDLAPLAREIARERSVLEPFQSRLTVDGLTEELAIQIEQAAEPPVALLGHSWGALLVLLLAVRRPELVRSLLLVGSAPLEARAALEIEARRARRLAEEDRERLARLLRQLREAPPAERGPLFLQVGELLERADQVDPLPHPQEVLRPQPEVFRSVWPEVAELRRSGEFIRAAAMVKGRVWVLHGEGDPHPVEGVVRPLRASRADLEVQLLPSCGHAPWHERGAREVFYDALRRELDHVLGPPAGAAAGQGAKDAEAPGEGPGAA